MEWFEKCRPDVVIAFTDTQYSFLKAAGYRMPEDVGFASLHLEASNLEESLPRGGLLVRRDRIARESVIILDQLIRHNLRGFPEARDDLLIPAEWHMGKTLLNRNG